MNLSVCDFSKGSVLENHSSPSGITHLLFIIPFFRVRKKTPWVGTAKTSKDSVSSLCHVIKTGGAGVEKSEQVPSKCILLKRFQAPPCFIRKNWLQGPLSKKKKK